MTDEFQFYPTPFDLAEKAWSMFKDKNFSRVLEPSAGNGDLLLPTIHNYGNRFQNNKLHLKVDVLEIDATKHPLLTSRGAKVVGFDFMDFTAVSRYSHVIMNPPFAYGAQHLLHAWQHLYDGEIVCILNAETLKNAFSKERQLLLRIIQEHGRVEFVGAAFAEAERTTEVEVALVHLVKKAEASNLVGDLLSTLRTDEAKPEDDLDFGFRQQLALPKGLVEDAVLRFDCAVHAAREAAQAQAKAEYYAAALGRSFSEMTSKELDEKKMKADGVEGRRNDVERERAPKAARELYAAAYEDLKDRAWISILRSTEVLAKLSSKAQKRMETEFETIKGLEFTTRNVYGFLQGLCESATAIQMDMVLDVFDEIVRYHEDNTVFYMGWKSNGHHRTAGMRLKASRFILPGYSTQPWQKGLDFEGRRQLADFDKVFAMLDGKREEHTVGLVALFENKDCFERLRSGSRETSDYFEVRYYPKRGTIHFYPRSQELMDRLNRLVGQRRQWLPPEHGQANADFHTQYEKAEKFDSELRQEFQKAVAQGSRYAGWSLGQVVRVSTGQERFPEEGILNAMDTALDAVMDNHGLKPQAVLGNDAQPSPLQLEMAA